MQRLIRAARRRPFLTCLLAALVVLLSISGILGSRRWRADYHLRAAERELAQRNYDAAWRHMNRALELQAEDAAAHFLAARSARRFAYYEDAKRHLAACARLGWPADAVALEHDLCQAQDGELASVERRLQRMVDVLDHPESPAILEALARGYRKTFQYGNALHALELWLQRRPDDVLALIWRGQINEELGRRTPALADYRRATELAPEDQEARGLLALALQRDGQMNEAAGHFAYLLSRWPNNPSVAIGLARCHRECGRLDEARELIERVLAAHPEDGPALGERGKLALQDGEAAAAADCFRRALAQDPSDEEIRYNLALCLQRLGRDEEATPLFAEVDRARADRKQLRTVTDRVRQSPRDPDPRAEAGALCLRLGRAEEGLLWYASVLRLNPRHRATREALADYYERAGNHVVAERHRRFLVDH